jgi:hypothetical protein
LLFFVFRSFPFLLAATNEIELVPPASISADRIT